MLLGLLNMDFGYIMQHSLLIFSFLSILLMFKFILDKNKSEPLIKKILFLINIAIIPLLIIFVFVVFNNAIKVLNTS